MKEIDTIIINDCQQYIKRSWSARTIYLRFFVAVNLAYFGGLYILFDPYKENFILLLSSILFLLNFSLFTMYVREHKAAKDNSQQILALLKKDKNFNITNHYIKSEGFGNTDTFKNLSIFPTLAIFLVFITIPLCLMFIIAQDQTFHNIVIVIGLLSLISCIRYLGVINVMAGPTFSITKHLRINNILYLLLFILSCIIIYISLFSTLNKYKKNCSRNYSTRSNGRDALLPSQLTWLLSYSPAALPATGLCVIKKIINLKEFNYEKNKQHGFKKDHTDCTGHHCSGKPCIFIKLSVPERSRTGDRTKPTVTVMTVSFNTVP